jgi:23S rRNA (uracil1939-C5)-methyltransferase
MSRRKRRSRLPQEPVEVTIESMNHDGRGVTHVEDKTLFVTGALPGEKVLVRYLKKQRRYDEAVTVEVLQPSDKRIKPRCDQFGVCGGCSLQHLADEDQIRFKQDALLDTLTRIGKVKPVEVLPPLTNDTPWGYRRKARLGVKYVTKQERVFVGFREKGTSLITETPVCHVMHPDVGLRFAELAELVGKLSIYDKLPQIEVAVDDSHCILILRNLEALTADDEDLLKQYAAQNHLTFYLQPGGPDSVVPLTETVQLNYALPGYSVDFDFRPTDFTQVNTDINRKMVSLALSLLDPKPEDRVLDLFCGLGNFTLPLATCSREVVGVEGDAELIDRARLNARRNGIENTRYFLANLYEPVEQEAWFREKFDCILLDPPRSGAFEMVKLIDRFKARRIVYVSCYPGTLARDLDVLVNEKGYKLEKAGVMDMFPHTGHVESIALLTKK